MNRIKEITGCLSHILLMIGMLAFGLIFGPLLSTLFGLIGGWFVGLFFGDIILGFFAQIGITGFSMWQIGAVLGFIFGFLRVTFKTKES